MSRLWLLPALSVVVLWSAGCGSAAPDPAKAEASKSAEPSKQKSKKAVAKSDELQPLSLGGGSTAPTPGGTAPAGRRNGDGDEQSVVQALQPFNVLLGQWSGKTKKQFDGFAKIDSQKWAWDYKTDRTHPSVAFESDKNHYFTRAWLTWLSDKQLFRMTVETPEKEKRVLEGTWTEGGDPRQESDGKKMQWTYKLNLTQVEPADGELWKVEFFLRENNEYMVTLNRKPAKGNAFTQIDVVRSQREGTSFAVVDSDNPGPKCIVSGGLGSMTVMYKGKSYPVCCSGCAAAFEEDPERWLAKLAKQEAEMKKNE